jgi:hypothetical protein
MKVQVTRELSYGCCKGLNLLKCAASMFLSRYLTIQTRYLMLYHEIKKLVEESVIGVIDMLTQGASVLYAIRRLCECLMCTTTIHFTYLSMFANRRCQTPYEIFVNEFYPVHIEFSAILQCVIQMHSLIHESKRNGSIDRP